MIEPLLKLSLRKTLVYGIIRYDNSDGIAGIEYPLDIYCKYLEDNEDIYKWYDTKYCLEAVKQYGRALRFVKEQTNEICLEAVKQDGDALQYVKGQTNEICLETVKQNGYALQDVKEQTNEICLEAVKQYGCALKFVKEQTNEICVSNFIKIKI